MSMDPSMTVADRGTLAGRLALGIGFLPLMAAGPVLPASVARQLPAGYVVLASARLAVGPQGRTVRIVALGRKGEGASAKSGNAPPRPLIIYEQRRNGDFAPAGRNDHVVLAADEGGQCDPFLDGGGTISVKGRFFTVENGVACGQHWTDYVTFRLDGAQGFVFDNERLESWSLNKNEAPDAEALVMDGPQHVLRDRPGHLTRFSDWQSRR